MVLTKNVEKLNVLLGESQMRAPKWCTVDDFEQKMLILQRKMGWADRVGEGLGERDDYI